MNRTRYIPCIGSDGIWYIHLFDGSHGIETGLMAMTATAAEMACEALNKHDSDGAPGLMVAVEARDET